MGAYTMKDPDPLCIDEGCELQPRTHVHVGQDGAPEEPPENGGGPMPPMQRWRCVRGHRWESYEPLCIGARILPNIELKSRPLCPYCLLRQYEAMAPAEEA